MRMPSLYPASTTKVTITTHSRNSSLLPLPTARKNSSSLSISSSKSSISTVQTSINSYEKVRKTKNSDVVGTLNSSTHLVKPLAGGSIRRTTRLPIRESSLVDNQTMSKPTNLKPSSSLSKSLNPSMSSGRAAGKRFVSVSRKPGDKPVKVDQSKLPLPPQPPSARGGPRLPAKSFTTGYASRPLLGPPAGPASAGPRSQRSVASNTSVPPLPVQNSNRPLSAFCELPIPPRQPRKVRSEQALGQQDLSSFQCKPQTKALNASPDSFQSNITFTDGESSARENPSISHLPDSRAGALRLEHEPDFVELLEFGTSQTSARLASASDHPSSSELQHRQAVIAKIRALIGTEKFQTLVDVEALHRLINQSEFYETQDEIHERIFQSVAQSVTPGQYVLACPPYAPDSNSRSVPLVPQATLELPPNISSTSNSPLTTFKSPTILLPEPLAGGSEGSTKKSSHVGNILLEKLGWKSKVAGSQLNKFGSSKGNNKTLRPSSFIKAKTSGQSSASDKVTHSDQRRFSQVLGAKLEKMNNSTCAVKLGERLHILPVLPYSVIEEIYRRGMRIPGILRISGNLDRIDALVKAFENSPAFGPDISFEDIHTLCGLFKHYLRALPEPLFHPLLSQLFWTMCVEPDCHNSSSKTDPNSLQLVIARYLLELFPTRHLSLLAYVIPFLAQIPTFAENLIHRQSLATMLGPAIFAHRDIGLTGLGLPSRAYKPNSSAITHLILRSSPAHPPSSARREVDKNEVSQRATECTLWMMDRWKLLFRSCYSSQNRETVKPLQVPNKLPDRKNPAPRPQELANLVFFPSDQYSQITELLMQSPPRSPALSIVTYSSGLSNSQRSTVLPDSPLGSPPTSHQSHNRLADDEGVPYTSGLSNSPRSTVLPGSPLGSPPTSHQSHHHLADDEGHRNLELGPGRLPEDYKSRLQRDNSNNHHQTFGLGLSLPGYVVERHHELEASEDTIQPSPKKSRPLAMPPINQLSEKGPSQTLSGLLTVYVEGKEDETCQQDFLIQRLVADIEKKNLAPDSQEGEWEMSLKKTKVDNGNQSPRFDQTSSQESNSTEVTPKNFVKPSGDSDAQLKASTLSSTYEETGNTYLAYHEQIFNFAPAQAVEETWNNKENLLKKANEGLGFSTSSESDSTLESSHLNSSSSPKFKRKKSAYLDYHQQMFNHSEENTNDSVVEELEGGKPTTTLNSPFLNKNPLSNEMIDLAKGTHQSHVERLESQIAQLKNINSSLVRKLKSIESILCENL